MAVFASHARKSDVTSAGESALSAARGWRFAPMRIEGQPTPAQFVLTIRYRVD